VDVLEALDAAESEFGDRLALVRDPATWTSATPCPGWDVHYLVAHVVGGNRFAASVLGGASSSDAIEEVMSTPQLGDDPMGAWTTTAMAQRAAFEATILSHDRIDHPLGAMTTRDFLGFRVFDITIHAWDLARSIRVDETIGPDLISHLLTMVQNWTPGMGFEITPVGSTRVDDPPQARLLDLAGRH